MDAGAGGADSATDGAADTSDEEEEEAVVLSRRRKASGRRRGRDGAAPLTLQGILSAADAHAAAHASLEVGVPLG